MIKYRQYSACKGYRRSIAWLAMVVLFANAVVGSLYIQSSVASTSLEDVLSGAQIVCTANGIKIVYPDDKDAPNSPSGENCPACMVRGQAAVIPLADTMSPLLHQVADSSEHFSYEKQIFIQHISHSNLRNRAPPLFT